MADVPKVIDPGRQKKLVPDRRESIRLARKEGLRGEFRVKADTRLIRELAYKVWTIKYLRKELKKPGVTAKRRKSIEFSIDRNLTRSRYLKAKTLVREKRRLVGQPRTSLLRRR